MLARGELRAVGATTLDEYRKYIEKDAALERRFQPVTVGEPTVADTIAILRGLKERYEVHHKVRIQDSALIAAATLSHRYIADRFLPDKAIDLIDEAASKIRIEIDSLPTEIDEVDRRVMQLEIELTSLKKEKDAPPRSAAGDRARAGGAEGALGGDEGPVAEGEGRDPGHLELKERLEQAAEMERAEREADLQRAAELRYGEIPELEKQACRTRIGRPSASAMRRARRPGVPQGGGRRRRHRRGRRALDGHPRQPPAGGRNGEAAPHGGAPARTRRRPGRGDRGGRQRAAPLARGPAGPRPADRHASCSSARRASARPSSRARSPSSCSTPRTR
jgi:hypothetical protein